MGMSFQELIDGFEHMTLQRRQVKEGHFAYLIRDSAVLPDPHYAYHFHPSRKWEFDFAWPDQKLAVEIEGGIWIRGRHNRGAGYEQDCEKYNQAVLLGWRVLRFTPEMVENSWPDVQEVLEQALRPLP